MRIKALAAVLLAVLLAVRCGGGRDTPADVITLAVPSSPNNLDPRIGTDEVSQKIQQLVYSTLFALNERLEVVGLLAERWDSPTPTTYVVSLRKGVRFHDGHELTSDDVVYTFTSLLDPSFISPRKGAYRMLDHVRAVDPYTVEFTLKEPFGSFPINLVIPIVPKGAGASLRNAPIGTGPYRFVSFAVDDRVVLAPFEGYMDGAPGNGGVVIKVVPDDTMRGLELRKGGVDLVVNDLAPDIVHQLRADPTLQVVEAPGTDYAYVGLNLRDSILKDVRVRQALAYAVDRDAIVRHLRRGLARPAVGILPPMSWAFTADVPDYRFDPARAGALLDEAGYRDPDGPGPAPRLHLTLKVSSTEFNRLQSSVLQQDFARVGVALDVRTYEFATLYADVLERQLPALHAAVGRRVRPRHAAARVPHQADAAERLQSRVLQQRSRGRAHRRGDGLKRRRAAARPVCRRATAHQPGGTVRQSLVQDQRRRRAARPDRPATVAGGRLPVSAGCDARLAAICRPMSAARWALVAVLALGSPVLAGPYDPALRFVTHRTPHFQIHYHQSEGPLATRLAAIAEATHVRLTSAWGLPDRRMTQVVLVDQSDLSNGSATVVPWNAIVIYPVPPSGASTIGNTDDWLEYVFTHEYAHILHLDRSRGWARLARGLLWPERDCVSQPHTAFVAD